MKIGAHMSAAGGVVRAVERAVLHRCEALQLFTKNNARWSGRPIGDEEAERFRDAVGAAALSHVVSHASYLINLAAPPGPVRVKSLAALEDELARADQLGLLGVVVHPGAAAPGMHEDEALTFVAEGLGDVIARGGGGTAMILIEHTAGQGRSIGHRFEHLAAILAGLSGSPRIGVCLDTCHLLASGYDIASEEGYTTTLDAFDGIVGFDRLRVVHANDSKRPLGSRLDRHEHIGRGHVGLAAFRRLLRDPRLEDVPMVIETHKTPGLCDHPTRPRLDPLDQMNLRALREARGGRSPFPQNRP